MRLEIAKSFIEDYPDALKDALNRLTEDFMLNEYNGEDIQVDIRIRNKTDEHPLTTLAKKLYNEHVDNSGIHCDRFPSWEELSHKSRSEWITKASEHHVGI